MRAVLMCFMLGACALPEPAANVLSAGDVEGDGKGKSKAEPIDEDPDPKEKEESRSKYIKAKVSSSSGDIQELHLWLTNTSSHDGCLFSMVEICLIKAGAAQGAEHYYLTNYSRTSDFTASDMTFSNDPEHNKYVSTIKIGCERNDSSGIDPNISYITWQRVDGGKGDYNISDFKTTDVELTAPPQWRCTVRAAQPH